MVIISCFAPRTFLSSTFLQSRKPAVLPFICFHPKFLVLNFLPSHKFFVSNLLPPPQVLRHDFLETHFLCLSPVVTSSLRRRKSSRLRLFCFRIYCLCFCYFVCVSVFVFVFLYLCLCILYLHFFPLTAVNLDILPEAKERLPHTSIIKSQNTNLCFCIGIIVHVFFKEPISQKLKCPIRPT